jgi:hypothetical protein
VRHTLKLSPLARLYLTLDNEFQRDPSFVADEARYKRLLDMLKLSEQKRDSLLRNFMILDAIALLLLFGKSISVPVINTSLSEIPAARDILIFFSSFTFQFAAVAFLNWNSYSAIIDTINLQRSRQTGIDPDYISASDKFFEFAVKLYRTKMNIRGTDYVVPGRAYQIVSQIIISLLVTTMLSLLCLHLIIVGVSLRQTILTVDGEY